MGEIDYAPKNNNNNGNRHIENFVAFCLATAIFDFLPAFGTLVVW